MVELISITGRHKGKTWSLNETPLLVGSSNSAHVQVRHPAVAGLHCQLVKIGNDVFLQDLGSKHPARVNGQSARECRLTVGDEMALGSDVFLLAGTADENDDRLNTGGDTKTSPSGIQESTAIQDKGRPIRKTSPPGTVADLALLKMLMHDIEACRNEADMYCVLGCYICERFNPCAAWFARIQVDQELLVYTWDHPESPYALREPPLNTLEHVRRERSCVVAWMDGHGESPKQWTRLLAAAVYHSGEDLGVLAVQPLTYQKADVESDLTLLKLITKSVAPYLHAINTLEQASCPQVVGGHAGAGASTGLIGKSKVMIDLRKKITQAARTDIPVLILGETGTGKEVAARMIQARSIRHARPFVVVNCAAIPQSLFESELFGYEKGSFTGAIEKKPGLIATADKGTLFLDEIGDLSLDNQARILRFIEYGAFRRVGATAEIRVDVRIIAATNKDLMTAIRRGEFRADLYHRLNGFEINMAPLRTVPGDIPLLVRHFLDLARAEMSRPLVDITSEAIDYLGSCRWPGNVRQLRSRIFRAVAIAQQSMVGLDDVYSAEDHAAKMEENTSPMPLQEMERRHIEAVLEICNGDIQRAARILQIGRSTLYRKLGEYQSRQAEVTWQGLNATPAVPKWDMGPGAAQTCSEN